MSRKGQRHSSSVVQLLAALLSLGAFGGEAGRWKWEAATEEEPLSAPYSRGWYWTPEETPFIYLPSGDQDLLLRVPVRLTGQEYLSKTDGNLTRRVWILRVRSEIKTVPFTFTVASPRESPSQAWPTGVIVSKDGQNYVSWIGHRHYLYIVQMAQSSNEEEVLERFAAALAADAPGGASGQYGISQFWAVIDLKELLSWVPSEHMSYYARWGTTIIRPRVIYRTKEGRDAIEFWNWKGDMVFRASRDTDGDWRLQQAAEMKSVPLGVFRPFEDF